MTTVRTITTIDYSDLVERNAKVKQAMKDGFFYFKLTQEMQELISSCIEFANTFYTNEQLKKGGTFKGKYTGYMVRGNYNLESFFCAKADWETVFNEKQKILAKKATELGIEILKAFRDIAKIPEDEWNKVTGGLTTGKEQVHFSFNHYNNPQLKIDPEGEKRKTGGPEHTDFGDLTVLYNNKEGLQAEIGGQMVDVKPKEDCFIINTAQALEILIDDDQILNACRHQVKISEDEDRISFGIFIDQDPESKLYQRQKDGEFKVVWEVYNDYTLHCFQEASKVLQPEGIES